MQTLHLMEGSPMDSKDYLTRANMAVIPMRCLTTTGLITILIKITISGDINSLHFKECASHTQRNRIPEKIITLLENARDTATEKSLNLEEA